MAEGKDEQTYATYKGMGYVSMFMGVPLGPLLILLGAGLFGAFILSLAFGWFGLIPPAICLLLIMCLKILCETNNRAMERAAWLLKAWKMRLSKASAVLTVSPNKSGSKHEHFFRSLKKIHRAK